MGIMMGIVSFVLGLIVNLANSFASLMINTLGFDLSYFFNTFLFAQVSQSIFVAIGIAFLGLGFVWQFLRMYGVVLVGSEGENPIHLIFKVLLTGILVVHSRSGILWITGYFQLILNDLAAINIPSPGGSFWTATNIVLILVDAAIITLGAAAGGAGLIYGGLMVLVGIILVLYLAWQLIKLLLEIVERYIVYCFVILIAPVFIATAAFNTTRQAADTWARAFFGHSLLIILNLWSIRMFASGAMSLQTAGGPQAFILGLFMLIAFTRFAMRIDSFLRILGLNTAHMGTNMGNSLLMAGLAMSKLGRGINNAGNSIASSFNNATSNLNGTTGAAGSPAGGGGSFVGSAPGGNGGNVSHSNSSGSPGGGGGSGRDGSGANTQRQGGERASSNSQTNNTQKGNVNNSGFAGKSPGHAATFGGAAKAAFVPSGLANASRAMGNYFDARKNMAGGGSAFMRGQQPTNYAQSSGVGITNHRGAALNHDAARVYKDATQNAGRTSSPESNFGATNAYRDKPEAMKAMANSSVAMAAGNLQDTYDSNLGNRFDGPIVQDGFTSDAVHGTVTNAEIADFGDGKMSNAVDLHGADAGAAATNAFAYDNANVDSFVLSEDRNEAGQHDVLGMNFKDDFGGYGGSASFTSVSGGEIGGEYVSSDGTTTPFTMVSENAVRRNDEFARSGTINPATGDVYKPINTAGAQVVGDGRGGKMYLMPGSDAAENVRLQQFANKLYKPDHVVNTTKTRSHKAYNNADGKVPRPKNR